MTKMIQIHNIGSLAPENIELYFESSRSGGGAIDRFEYFPAEGYALLELQDMQGKIDCISR